MALALPSDREQPIRVQADSAELDDKQGIAVYRGDVVVTQGSTKLTGNTVTLKQDKNGDIEVVTSVGKPAYYEQKPAPDKDVTKAYGLTIQYFVTQNRVVLIDQAKVIQEGNTFEGEKIVYDTQRQIVNAGRATGSPGDQPAPAHRHGHPAEEKGPVMATLKAQHLAKSYKGRQVVRDVSMSIDSGQIVGLLGPNGAGKTTCFYMIVGLVQADQGVVRIDEQNVTHLPMHGRARAGIGYRRRKPRSSASCRYPTTSWRSSRPAATSIATVARKPWKACCRNSTSTTSATTSA